MGLGNEELAKIAYCCWCSWLAMQWTVHLVSKHRSTKGQWVYCRSPGELGLIIQASLHPLGMLPSIMWGLNNLCFPGRLWELKVIWRWELERLAFPGNVHAPLAWRKVSPRSPEMDLFFCFLFLQKKEWGIQWVIACSLRVWDACLWSR